MTTLTRSPRPPLQGPFATPPDPDGIRVTPAVEQLVSTQVQALLDRSPAYYSLPHDQRQAMQRDLTKIAAYSAALLQDNFGQAQRLGQTPVLRHQVATREPAAVSSPARAPAAQPRSPVGRAAAQRPAPQVRTAADRSRTPVARAAAEDPATFAPRAVGQVATVTRETLDAIDFPGFVADLIRGSFDAIVTSSIQQMEAFGELLANVAKTVDQFMADNITDNQARDYLAARYPGHVVVDAGGSAPVARLRQGADDLPRPDLRTDLGVDDDVALDDDTIEEVLVPAARRQLAQSRHQVLSTMVLMGINRIVVTSGRVKAKIDFHIDAKDTARAESASRFDFKHDTVASGWFGFGAAASRTSVAYVKTAKQVATDEINVDVDLTGELDLKFRSETFPLERFADAGVIGQIQAATPNPSANPVAAPTTPVRRTE